MLLNISNTSNKGVIINYFNYFHDFEIICYYLMFITVPIGMTGNLLSAYIFTRPTLNQRTNTGFLYTILSILNLARILFQATFKNWHSNSEYNIKVHFQSELFIEYVISQLLSWNQALISFDRFIVVFSPVKGVRIMGKKRVLYSIMFGLFVIILFANSPNFIRSSTTSTFNNRTTVQNGKLRSEIQLVIQCVKIFMEVYIPYLIIVFLDIMAVVCLKRSKVNILTGNNRTFRFTINTILIDLIYLIFHIPYAFTTSILLLNFFNFLKISKPFAYIGVFSFILNVFELLPFYYSCFVFFVFLIFNRNFRFELFSIGFLVKIKDFFVSQRNSSQNNSSHR